MGKTINIVVCIKQVKDQEAPASYFEIDSKNLKITAEGVAPVINPLDESALELALRIKDTYQDAKIVVLGVGRKISNTIMSKSLAVGADELYLIDSGETDMDSCSSASVLAAAIKTLEFDLILTGRQAADTNSGGTGLALAELLAIPAVSWARNVNIDQEELIVERITPEGVDFLRGSLPALVTVSFEAGEIRTAKVSGIRDARKKPIHLLKLNDLELEPDLSTAIACVQLEAPSRLKRNCQFLDGESPEDLAAGLTATLVDQGVLKI